MPWESRPVELSAQQREVLKETANSRSAAENEKCRALIVLLLGEGLKNKEIARRLNIHENTVVKWRGRWSGENSDAKVSDYGQLTGRPRSVLIPENLQRIQALVDSTPPDDKPRWTVRSLAHVMQLPVATIHRALKDLNVNLLEKKNKYQA